MKIVIDIPEEDFERCKKRFQMRINIMSDAIAKGTPLPKGHGKMIDADVIKDFKDRIKCYKEDYAFSQKEILNIMERYEIKYRKTIIEADKDGK